MGSTETTNNGEVGPIAQPFAQILQLEGCAMTRQLEHARRTPDRPYLALGRF